MLSKCRLNIITYYSSFVSAMDVLAIYNTRKRACIRHLPTYVIRSVVISVVKFHQKIKRIFGNNVVVSQHVNTAEF